MIVLKIIGIVLLSIIALIILALCVKVKIFAEYSEIDTKVRIHWLFAKIPLYPAEKKANTKDSNKKSKSPSTEEVVTEEPSTTESSTETDGQTDASEAAENNPTETGEKPAQKSTLLKDIYGSHGIDGLLLVVKRIFGYLGTYVGKLMNSLVIDELYIDVKCNKNDAAQTAIYYGEVCSALFPMLGALVTKYKVRKYDINVYPDFLARHSSASFAVSMHLYPIHLIGITSGLLFNMLFKVLIGFIVKLLKFSKNKNVQTTDKKTSVDNK